MEKLPTIWKPSRQYRTLQIIWKFSRHSGNFPDNLVTCQKIWKLSRSSILSKLYKKFPDKTSTFQTIPKRSRQWQFSRRSRNFPETSVIFQTSSRYNRKKYVQCKKKFWTRKYFPGRNAPALLTYFCLCLVERQTDLVVTCMSLKQKKDSLFLLKVWRFQTML